MLALVFGLVAVSPPSAQEPKAASPLPAHVVAAWEKADAQVGWFVPDEYGRFSVRHRAAGVNGEVPGFVFATSQPARGCLAGCLPLIALSASCWPIGRCRIPS